MWVIHFLVEVCMFCNFDTFSFEIKPDDVACSVCNKSKEELLQSLAFCGEDGFSQSRHSNVQKLQRFSHRLCAIFVGDLLVCPQLTQDH